MPPVKKVSKDDIINASYDIVREFGIDSLNARGLAKKLGCSTQPIFSCFTNMDEIKNEVINKINKYFNQYMLKSNYDHFVYKDIGRNYIMFAKEEPVFFKILFNNIHNISINNFMELSGPTKEILNVLSSQTNLSLEDAKNFHLKMWLCANGIANLIATGTCKFSDKEIETLLKDQYVSNILLEIQKGKINPIVLKETLEQELKRKEEK